MNIMQIKVNKKKKNDAEFIHSFELNISFSALFFFRHILMSSFFVVVCGLYFFVWLVCFLFISRF